MKEFFFVKSTILSKFWPFVQTYFFSDFCIKLSIQVEKDIHMKNLTFDRQSTTNLPSLTILKKCVFFRKKNHLFFRKKPQNFVRFEKFYYFSRNLRRICYNLVMKNFETQNRILAYSVKSDIINWQKRKKKTFWLSGWFSSHIIKVVENNI